MFTGQDDSYNQHHYFDSCNDNKRKILSTSNFFRNDTILKEISGGDTLYYKQLYPDEPNGFYFPPTIGKLNLFYCYSRITYSSLRQIGPISIPILLFLSGFSNKH